MEEITLYEILLIVLNMLMCFLLGLNIGERLGVKNYPSAFVSSNRTMGNLIVPLPPKIVNLSSQQSGGEESINPNSVYPKPSDPSVVETGKKQNINEYLGV